MNWKIAIPRVLLGLIFFVFGLNKLFLFLPVPEMPEPAVSFMSALVATGYFMVVLALTEVVAGALLLVNRFVPLALILLAPVVVQILLFHLFLAPDGLVIAIVLVALEAWLAWVYRDAFRDVLRANGRPSRENISETS